MPSPCRRVSLGSILLWLESTLVSDPAAPRPSLADDSRALPQPIPSSGGSESLPVGSLVGRRLHHIHMSTLAAHAAPVLPGGRDGAGSRNYVDRCLLHLIMAASMVFTLLPPTMLPETNSYSDCRQGAFVRGSRQSSEAWYYDARLWELLSTPTTRCEQALIITIATLIIGSERATDTYKFRHTIWPTRTVFCVALTRKRRQSRMWSIKKNVMEYTRRWYGDLVLVGEMHVKLRTRDRCCYCPWSWNEH